MPKLVVIGWFLVAAGALAIHIEPGIAMILVGCLTIFVDIAYGFSKLLIKRIRAKQKAKNKPQAIFVDFVDSSIPSPVIVRDGRGRTLCLGEWGTYEDGSRTLRIPIKPGVILEEAIGV